MEKEFIPYEQALALKELGFDEPCIRGWDKDEGVWYHPDSDIILDNPTFSQAFRLFREKYDLHSVFENDSDNYYYVIQGVNDIDFETIDSSEDGEIYQTYEGAELECLKKLIQIVKEKKL